MTVWRTYGYLCVCLTLLVGCGESSNSESTTSAGVADTAQSAERIDYDIPAYFPGQDVEADSAEPFAGLKSAVRIVYDKRGIPHIYGKDMGDLAYAQGYAVAQMRLFQLHTLRMAGSGRLGEMLGAGSVQGDVLLRTLKLRSTAGKMAERIKEEHPEHYDVLQRFADGVNVWIDKVNSGQAPKPPEGVLFNIQFEPWTVTDSMTIVRLQTWDLGFGNAVDDDDAFLLSRELTAKWANTPLSGLVDDVIHYAPPAQVPTIELGASKPSAANSIRPSELLNQPFFSRLKTSTIKRMAAQEKAMENISHHMFRGEDYGSNNWIIHGDHTASGKPLLANDPHLSLRNPSVFYHVHLSNVLAGGDYEVNGVNFAGVPGIVLGNNRYGAWGATVFYSDVTDVYLEELVDDKTAVLFKGKPVALTERKESFEYALPKMGCGEVVTGWLENLQPSTEELENYRCRMTVTLQEVPHHGPVIPWSYDTDVDGKPFLMSWRWTGFEPTTESVAILGISDATNVDEFKAALDHFDVGAQNWIWADRKGNIAWYPSHQLPVREHIAKGDYSKPPYFPMPGTGGYEWDGYVPRSQLPQAVNPKAGYLVTANADPVGVSYDNDPFNDGNYLGYVWAPGFRMQRASERIAELVAKGGITASDMVAVQSDHKSPMGARVTPHLIDAIEWAQSNPDSAAAKYVTEQVVSVRKLLQEWSYNAADGVGATDGSPEAKDAAATALYNVFQSYLLENALKDEQGETGFGTALSVRLLLRMLESPESLKTWNPETKESRIWDNQDTPDVVETKAEIMLKSLTQALVFLSDKAKVGVANGGGFGTEDTSQWRWGALHTVTLKHNLTALNDLPDPETLPGGYPRHGDNFCVDASHPGIFDRSFIYSSGPAIRHVFELVDPIVRRGAIPGGQNEDANSSHYGDEMALYVNNEAPVVVWETEAVMAAKERIFDLVPTSAVKARK